MTTMCGRVSRAIPGRLALIGGLAAAMVAAPLIAQQPSRARLGITVDVHQSAAIDAKGVRVERVLPGGPADQAGIRAGDIITSVAGESVVQPLPGNHEKGLDPDRSAPVQRLIRLSSDLDPGQKVEVRYLRDGASHTVTLEARDLSDGFVLDLSSDSTLRSHMQELRERMRDLSDSLRGLGDSLGHLRPRLYGLRYRMLDSMPRIRMWVDSSGHRDMLIGGWSPDSIMRTLRFRVGPGARDQCPGREPRGFVRVFGDDCVGGVQLVTLNPGLASYFHTDEGVLVTDVRKDSGLGLQPGDVILRIGARDATSPDEVRRILRSYEPDETIAFHIERKGKTMDVSGHLRGS